MRTLKLLLVTTLIATGLWSAAPQAAAPRLSIFYAVHVHALGMEASAFDTRLAQKIAARPRTSRMPWSRLATPFRLGEREPPSSSRKPR